MGRLTNTLKAPVGSFKTPYAVPIRKLRAHFYPKQIGTGEPSSTNRMPFDEGWDSIEVLFGQNKIERLSSDIDITSNGVHIVMNRTSSLYHIQISGIASDTFKTVLFSAIGDGDEYTFSGFPILDYDAWRYGIGTSSEVLSNGTDVSNINDISVQVADGERVCVIFNAVANREYNLDFYPRVTKEKPLKIIFPGVGKNLLNPNTCVEGKALDGNGNESINSSCKYSALIPVNSGESYTLSGTNGVGTDIDIAFHSYDASGNWINRFDTATAANGVAFTRTVTIPSTAKYIRISMPDIYTDAQLEKNSSATEYEAFTNKIIGGYVDLLTGEIAIATRIITMDGVFVARTGTGFTGKSSRTENVQYYAKLSNAMSPKSKDFDTGQVKFNGGGVAYKVSVTVTDQTLIGYITASGYVEPRIAFPLDTTYTTLAKANAYLAEQYANGTPLEYTYPYTTPIIAGTFIPEDWSICIGQNNFWSNADKVEVEYDFAETAEMFGIRRKILAFHPLEIYEKLLSDIRRGITIPNGTEFVVPHSEFGDITFVTRRQNVDKLANNPNAPTLTIQSKYLLQTDDVGTCLRLHFDGKEAMFSALENEIPNGTTVSFTSIEYNSWTAGAWHFVANATLPAGTLFCLSGGSSTALSSLNVQAFSSPTAITPFATMSILSGDGGATINLGTWGTNGNHPHRISDGSNNLFESNIFQWMNTLSNGSNMSQVFVPKTKYDMLSAHYTNRIGFMDGFPEKFIKCLGLASIHNITNNIYESDDSIFMANSSCTYNGYFWLISRKELYGTNENDNESSETQFEYYATTATTDASKVGYTKDSSTKRSYWLRTPYRKFAGQSRISNSDLNGSIYNTESNLANGCGIAPIAILG